jgi:hypothetical protein
MSEKRFVLDTNLLISAALFPKSVPLQVIDKSLALGKLLQSTETAKEIEEVVQRPKFDKYVSKTTRVEFINRLLRNALFVEITVTIAACRDPKDDKYLELAVSGKATCIVSSDKDLLALHPFREIPILAPADFLAQEVPPP